MRSRVISGIKVLYLLLIAVMMISGIAVALDEPISGTQVNDETEEMDKLPATKRDIKGVVVDMLTGNAVPGATVSLLKVTVTSGADGRFIMKDVPDYHAIQMTARITTDLDIVIGCSYFFIPTNYYPITANMDDKTDMQIINMLDLEGDIVLKVASYTNDNIDTFCEKCHESSPCLVEEEYGVSANGKVKLRGLLVRQSELEAYIEKMKRESMTIDRYSSIRYADSHPKAVDITTTESFDAGRVALPPEEDEIILKEDKIMVCTTCHTRHIPTEWGQYVIMDFLQQESICIKCHK